MKVKELIEKLQDFECPEAEVIGFKKPSESNDFQIQVIKYIDEENGSPFLVITPEEFNPFENKTKIKE